VKVCDYVQERLRANYSKLSQICEELFMHCLAPDADGDGTGCDNMTCIIVTFKPFRTGSFTNESSSQSKANVLSIMFGDKTKKEENDSEQQEEPITVKTNGLKRHLDTENGSLAAKNGDVKGHTASADPITQIKKLKQEDLAST
jgi:hypothetical protein